MKYPVEYGYNVEVEIIRDIETDTATVKVFAPFYMNKEYFLGHSYTSSQFTDSQILRDRDFQKAMLQRYNKM